MNTNIISTEDIYKLMAVRDPYFALKNLEEFPDGSLRADIPVEQPLGYEANSITAGETARHLAILGSCASALLTQKKELHYYLATKAIYKRHINEIYPEFMHAVAKAEQTSKRKTKAKTELLTHDKQIITSLEIDYTVLSQKFFERQFQEYRRDMRSGRRDLTNKSHRQNLYKQLFFTPVFDTSKNEITLNLGKIDPKMCMGHFPLYPALPVAFSSTILINVAISFLRQKLNKQVSKLCVKEAVMNADKILFSGTDVSIKIILLEAKKEAFIFKTQFINNLDSSVMMELSPLVLEEVYD